MRCAGKLHTLTSHLSETSEWQKAWSELLCRSGCRASWNPRQIPLALFVNLQLGFTVVTAHPKCGKNSLSPSLANLTHVPQLMGEQSRLFLESLHKCMKQSQWQGITKPHCKALAWLRPILCSFGLKLGGSEVWQKPLISGWKGWWRDLSALCFSRKLHLPYACLEAVWKVCSVGSVPPRLGGKHSPLPGGCVTTWFYLVLTLYLNPNANHVFY